VSSDYVFDGRAPVHREDEPVAPLGVYGQTKAAGDAIVATVPRHYVVRTSWVVGEGRNFVATMRSLAERGVDPSVVDDQVGRLAFAADIAAGIVHLLASGAPFGTYNLSNTGEPMSWADIARAVFAAVGADPTRVSGVSTEAYFAGKQAAPRPRNSVLDLGRLEATGFHPRDQHEALLAYLAG
jgi:dTDP-4-dehydrorhamnose 3,5-epimerase